MCASPGSEIAGEAAAGLAAAYVVMKANKFGTASTVNSYLSHAEDLYAFATGNPGSYQDLKDPCLAQHGELYKSTGDLIFVYTFYTFIHFVLWGLVCLVPNSMAWRCR